MPQTVHHPVETCSRCRGIHVHDPVETLFTIAWNTHVGASIGFHTHAGDEAGYVARGSITLKVRSEADHTVNAGETSFNVRGAVHSVVAGTDGATVVSTWIVDKGTPLANAVQ